MGTEYFYTYNNFVIEIQYIKQKLAKIACKEVMNVVEIIRSYNHKDKLNIVVVRLKNLMS